MNRVLRGVVSGLMGICSLVLLLGSASAASVYPPATVCPQNGTPQVPPGTSPVSPGHWLNPKRAGTGWNFIFNSSGQMRAIWYTYDNTHHPVWLISNYASFSAAGQWTSSLSQVK